MCVVVRDRVDAMMRCLDALAAQRGVEHYEVVVAVDAGSTEPVHQALLDRVAGFPVPLRVLLDPGPVAVRRNLALRAATGDVVAWTDSDCVPEPDWLAAGLAAFELGVTTVQGRTVPDPAVPIGGWVATQQIDAFTGIYETCNVFYRREVLLEAGGFDDSIGFWGEDMLAGLGVKARGGREVFAPDAVVVHEVSHPGFAWHVRRARYYAQWPRVVSRRPEVRDQLIARTFMRKQDPYVIAAALGLALAVRKPAAALAALPWLVLRRPHGLGESDLRATASLLVHDAVSVWWLVVGSVREGEVVL